MNRLTPARLSMVMFMVVGGLIAAYIAKGLLAQEEKKAAGSPTRNIPMAVSDLPAGTMITEAHLGIGPALNAKITRDVLLTNKVIVGRVTKEALKAAEPILSSQLLERGLYPPLKVRKGMQAMTISLGTTAVVDGLVRPGQFVDVHFSPASMVTDPRGGGGMTMTLFRGVKILAMNRLFTQSGVHGGAQGGDNSVTLEVSEGQANILLVAKDKGMLNFTYNPDGQGNGGLAVTGKDRVTLEEILGLGPIPKPEPPTPPVISQIYRGLNMKQYTYTKVGTKMLQSGSATIGGTSSQLVLPSNTGNPANPGQGQQPVQPPAPGVDAGSAPQDPSSSGSPDDPQGQQTSVPKERSI